MGRKHLEQSDRDRILHRPARFRVGVEDESDRRVFTRGLIIPRLDPACGSGDDQFAHAVLARSGPRNGRFGGLTPKAATNTISDSDFKFFV